MQRLQRGVSLVEALVALAVMGFGILGIVGLQMSLRNNADISKQRAEAVRMGQAIVEQRRAYSALASASAVTAFADIVNRGPTAASGPTSNTDFNITETVVDFNNPWRKSLVVDVQWKDRTDADQRIRLSTVIAGVPPALGAGLGFPGTADPRTRGRHGAIPKTAIDQGNGTSRFDLPGSTPTAVIRWIFDNNTGYITQTCTGLENSPTCITANRRLLQGFVVFATTATAPGPGDAESPPTLASLVGVDVQQTVPFAGTENCYIYQETAYVEYWCALRVDNLAGNVWTGRAEVAVTPLATAIADATATRVRVCRYTPVRGCQPAVGDTIFGSPSATASCTAPVPPATAASRPLANDDHPSVYVNVKEPLINKNFLVIRAGDGTTPFECPADDTATPLINGNTWHHQPSS
ncbi:MAG: prepilin-type N-terminal cleavage/methylation domain-containing protein [Hydrogenophaga sp.]|jgi:Tfp pilus assembly protein PilV|nr:prepilin-type N-terminal cleavage/methylation domain-containing protein [Hydrogenophaga sp.]